MPSPGSLSMSGPSDPVEGARAGAFREMVEPEIEVMLRVAWTMTASAADAEDLVQDALLRAYRGLDRFDGRYLPGA